MHAAVGKNIHFLAALLSLKELSCIEMCTSTVKGKSPGTAAE